MPLDLEIRGDPSSIRDSARWMSTVSESVHETGTQVTSARNGSESAWSGEAGDSFRAVLSKVNPEIDEVAEDHAAMCRELNKFADELDTAQKRMRRAREIAREAGLTVTEQRITEPGAEPAAPEPLPSDRPATPEEQQAHAAATRAQTAYARKVRAYQECSQIVTEAREQHNSALGVLNRFVSGIAEKSPFTITDYTTGLAGAVAGSTSAMRAAATEIADSGKIARAEKLMHSPNLGLRNQTRAAAIHARNYVNKVELENKATASRTARMVDKLSPNVQKALQLNMNLGVRPENVGNRLLRGSLRTASKLPVVGLGITGFSIGYDVQATDKSVGESAAINLGGYAAGSAATAGLLAMSTPVGWAVAGGVVVSVGVGFAIDEWGDDVVDAAGDAVNWTGNKLNDATDAVGDFVSDIF
ncbi:MULTISPECIES: WXG100 family type VII secretion target [unclassified Actinopolyspora]|uniref:WXG100 family type VII secretion target n=1 Tax=unclassified Actinopolyspora TaxID=2639451 RepID=UPI0013F59F69|nr:MULTISPECIES: WXG100 family type VII secretion target [unclassified Actinopolyspora]NHD18996.1 WXG100 family type VII secretion target [Actinopolyspora sp. BKK2]NHE78219.1 WXG100 family type VII secretion target [Actinopolyspora sp. BKK1]